MLQREQHDLNYLKLHKEERRSSAAGSLACNVRLLFDPSDNPP
jgi:hypothetical protein